MLRTRVTGIDDREIRAYGPPLVDLPLEVICCLGHLSSTGRSVYGDGGVRRYALAGRVSDRWNNRNAAHVEPLPRHFHQPHNLPGQVVHRVLSSRRQRLARLRGKRRVPQELGGVTL